ncbi:MAG: hypothetical protein QNK20_07420 [Aureibaculum sp.]|nr:hypothetical protein [Aureibaculum sp.]
MKKFIKIKTMILAALSLAILSSCLVDQSVEQNIQTTGYPTATFTLDAGATTFNEFSEPVFIYNIVTDKMIDRPIDISAVQVGGTATLHEDYDVENTTIPAYSNTAQLVVTIHNDAVVEGTETLSLQLRSGPSLANQFLINPATSFPTLDLTIEDWVFCNWTLEANDTYGDGWNGGYVELTFDGVTEQYSAHGPSDIFEIPVSDGADYTFTYVSGGGTGASPGWESENYYKLTAPDGTFWEGGTQDYSGIPTPGVITSGTNSCN